MAAAGQASMATNTNSDSGTHTQTPIQYRGNYRHKCKYNCKRRDHCGSLLVSPKLQFLKKEEEENFLNDNSCISPLRCMSDLPLAIFSGNMTVNWSSLHFPLSNIKGTYTKTFHFPYPKKWDLKKLSSTIFFAHLSFPAFLWLLWRFD